MRKNLVRVGAVVAGLALLAAACGDDDDDSSSGAATTAAGAATTAAGAATTAASGAATTAAGGAATTAASGGATCENLTIASFQALTGDAAGLGEPIKNAAELAINEFNEANPDCQVKFQPEDSQGSPDQAPGLAKKLVDQADVIGVVGPAFSGESKNAGPTFAAAGLPTITPSATAVDLSTNGWDTFHRLLGTDAVQGAGIARYIENTVKPTKVAVIDDASTYGKGLGDIVRSELGATVAVSDVIDPKGSDYSAAVTKVKDAGADTVFFGGYYEAAGRLAKQLADAGVEAQFISGDGSKDDGFMAAAGAAAEGAILTCPCAPAESLEKGGDFVTAYTEAYDLAPGTYAAESFDAANFFLAAIAEGNTDRASILEYINSTTFPGITKDVEFDDTGEVTSTAVYSYIIKDGKIVGEGLIP
jgi:branched-chain amino acid transport system substrate-binding protein